MVAQQFGRNRRFQGTLADRDPKDASTLYHAQYAQEPVGTITQQAPGLLVPNLFDDAQRAALIDYWEHGDGALACSPFSPTQRAGGAKTK